MHFQAKKIVVVGGGFGLPEGHLGAGETDVDAAEESSPSQWARQPSHSSLTARAARLENLFRMLACEASAVADQGATRPGFDVGVGACCDGRGPDE